MKGRQQALRAKMLPSRLLRFTSAAAAAVGCGGLIRMASKRWKRKRKKVFFIIFMEFFPPSTHSPSYSHSSDDYSSFAQAETFLLWWISALVPPPHNTFLPRTNTRRWRANLKKAPLMYWRVSWFPARRVYTSKFIAHNLFFCVCHHKIFALCFFSFIHTQIPFAL